MKKKIALILTTVLVLSSFMAVGFADTYTIQSGDVLWKIAKEHGMDYDLLAKVNGIDDPNKIFAGDTLNVNLVKQVDLLTTNDFHGKMEGGYEAGAAKLAAYFEYYKNMNPEGTLILDGGDSFQGSPMSNLLKGEPVVKFMNEVGYTATTVGNHEFDWGIEEIINTMEENGAEYPMLTANVYQDGKLVEWATPYLLTEVNGLTVGIIGLSTPDTAVTAHIDYVGDYTFEAPAPVAETLKAELEAKGADLVIVLSHLPASQDYETKEITGELADLANAVDGIDAMIGGHSHSRVTGEVNDTPLLMAYKHGRMIGHITLYYDTVAKEVIMNEIQLHDVQKGELEIEENAVVAEMVAGYTAELEPIFGQVVGTLSADLVREYNETSPAGNWFADVLKEAKGADFGFTNAGGIRVDVEAGEVTMGEIFEIMPFDNTPVTTTMTGKDILAVLEQGCTLSKGMVQISGLTFEYDSSKPEYERVLSVTMEDGTALDEAKEYLVVTNDFLAGGQDNYVTLADFTWSDPYQEPLLRDLLADSLKAAGTYTPDTVLRAVDVAQ